MSGPVSYLQPGSPAADKIEVEMKLDGPEQPRRAGVGAALRPPWAAAPSAVALGAALGQAGAMKREAGRADRPARALTQRPSPLLPRSWQPFRDGGGGLDPGTV